ncbi:hypothetical protein G5I_11197 [Acromyrmex echinatior]|uniref:Uncharacterized protein n=1 Tax=Acromyrmex echinatior TaxID=103372 RepID=F4WYY3_ACREC|nr:hypothetical protein G5I_11197 [Acromyrmex echinatior]
MYATYLSTDTAGLPSSPLTSLSSPERAAIIRVYPSALPEVRISSRGSQRPCCCYINVFLTDCVTKLSLQAKCGKSQLSEAVESDSVIPGISKVVSLHERPDSDEIKDRRTTPILFHGVLSSCLASEASTSGSSVYIYVPQVVVSNNAT